MMANAIRTLPSRPAKYRGFMRSIIQACSPLFNKRPAVRASQVRFTDLVIEVLLRGPKPLERIRLWRRPKFRRHSFTADDGWRWTMYWRRDFIMRASH